MVTHVRKTSKCDRNVYAKYIFPKCFDFQIESDKKQ
jgi:hypothetical protein